MDKIKREHWIAFTDRKPEPDTICLITDGNDVTVAIPDYDWQPCEWDIVGVSAYDYDLRFTPTHWMALSIELPSEPPR